ncbi:hypothetical protein UJ101_02284 [Flavobacteriaceae bacterium UJ101]|nr:hypothetical protein UJ101_02284 [Flavobacteriaceae bacterium UJ101]
MKYKEIARIIIELKNVDLEFRDKLIQNGQLGKGYNKEMEAIHNRNASELCEIIDKIGYPTIDKVGKEASEAAWLIIQHAISQPSFMKKCIKLLAIEVERKQANPINFAYVTDRIAVFEGKPQLYGTQFDWDENGEMSPNEYDDLNKVNERRKLIGLNTLEEQIQIMKERVKNERLTPIKDFEERRKEYNNWRKLVGWID